MCEQCTTRALSHPGEVLPGWRLIRARQDGRWMKAGDFGLLRRNDPDFWFATEPAPDPTPAGLTEAEEDAWIGAPGNCAAWKAWHARSQAFLAEIKAAAIADGGPEFTAIHALVDACRQAGWDRHRHGHFSGWLFDRIARHAAAAPAAEDDPHDTAADPALVEAARTFAIEAYAGLARRNRARTPLWEHAREVADLTAAAGGDPEEVAAALLHDVVEDTAIGLARIRAVFGDRVADLVDGLTDPPDFAGLPNLERKTRQAQRIVGKPRGVKLVKIADQTSNVRSLIADPPTDWSHAKSLGYCEGARRIVDACRGTSPALEAAFDEAHALAVAAHS